MPHTHIGRLALLAIVIVALTLKLPLHLSVHPRLGCLVFSLCVLGLVLLGCATLEWRTPLQLDLERDDRLGGIRPLRLALAALALQALDCAMGGRE